MTRRWRIWGAVAVVALVAGAGLYGWRQARGQTPLSITGPNILANADFPGNEDCTSPLPDGWTSGATGVQLGKYTFDGHGCSVQLLGVNNFLKSPFVAVRPGVEYRVAFRALSDSASATKVRIYFHWLDAEGDEIKLNKGEWQAVPSQNWNVISAAGTAPEDASQAAISIHPASDDRVYIDDLSMGQVGVRIAPWPDGKRAALAFSFDYETAMGGLVHSRSVDDPNAGEDYLVRARRMRAGAEEAIKLFAPDAIRASFYTTGYNFLTGNTEHRIFMGNPIYKWANTEPGHNWASDRWTTTPWFADDPYKTEAEAPEWYFGSQINQLQQARQDIQSHTFAHFAGTYVTPDDWRADFAAWKQVAQERGVAPATSLAFPWSSSAGMSFGSWDVLARQGIRSVTRTVWNGGQRRSWIADREHYALLPLLANPAIKVIADQYLTPKTRDAVLEAMQTALVNEGAIDVWAHTEEVTSADQITAWQAAINQGRQDFWIAPVPEIVQYAEDIQRVTVAVQAERPDYRFTIRNGSDHDLHGVTLTLPFAPQHVEIDGKTVLINGTTLVLDLRRGESKNVRLLRADARQSSDGAEDIWRA